MHKSNKSSLSGNMWTKLLKYDATGLTYEWKIGANWVGCMPIRCTLGQKQTFLSKKSLEFDVLTMWIL